MSDFRQLTEEENKDIRQARAWGYAVFFPALPDAEAQARNTLAGARKFLNAFRCTVCHKNSVDFANGYDTCAECLARQ